MKNTLKILSALLVLLCGFLFTGCDEIVEQLGGTDKWWTYTHTQEVSGGSVDLYFYFYYNTSDNFTKQKGIKALEDDDFVQGLNVVIAADPDADSDLVAAVSQGLAKGNFFMKTWDEDEKVAGFPIKKAWSSFYTINVLKDSEKMSDDDDYPPILAYKSNSKINDAGLEEILVSVLVAGLTNK